MPVTVTQVRRGIRQYMGGKRPTNYRAPKSWYLVELSTGRLFPLKAVWALVHDIPSTSFNTSVPIREMKALDGFGVVRHVDEMPLDDLQKQVEISSQDSPTKRLARLAKAKKKPDYYYQSVRVFRRNPDVIAETLFQSSGKCGDCKQEAPFNRRLDGTPFLEVHHRKPLAEGGDDSLANAIALCPNCHRKAHHG